MLRTDWFWYCIVGFGLFFGINVTFQHYNEYCAINSDGNFWQSIAMFFLLFGLFGLLKLVFGKK